MGTVYAHTFDNSVVWLSEVGGGNITFAHDFTADTFTVASNQIRFTNFEMNNNGSWTRIGFRNPDPNCTLEITHVGENYIQVNCTVDGDGTTYEVWLPDDGEPDTITGDNGNAWASPTLDLTKTANGTIILEWEATTTTTTTGGGGSALLPLFTAIMVFIMAMRRQHR